MSKIENNKELVPLFFGSEEDGFNQRCVYGYNVIGHAVYCDNDKSDVRKCRRSWYFGHDEAKKRGCADEDCPHYKANPNFKEATNV